MDESLEIRLANLEQRYLLLQKTLIDLLNVLNTTAIDLDISEYEDRILGANLSTTSEFYYLKEELKNANPTN